MKLHDLSKPSGKERRGTRDKQVKHRRALRSPDSIRKSIQRKADDIEARLDSKGVKPTFDDLTEMRVFLKGAVANVQPFNADGTPRDEPNRSMDIFLRVTDLFIRICAVLLPYERPRLAQISYREERSDDGPQEYATVWEMQTRLIKKGIPVDHIDSKPKLIEHHAAGDQTNTKGSVY
jgi:hypothetical protein